MKTASFTQAQIRRCIAAARKEGMRVVGIRPDGGIIKGMPAYVDVARLCKELSITDSSVIDTLIARHVLPPPVLIGDERRWKWVTVEALLSGRVYFIDGGDLIKIGFSRNIKQRFKDLQRTSPVKLTIICMVRGGKLREAAFHETFSHLRTYGEWFRATPELRNYIATLKSRPVEAVAP